MSHSYPYKTHNKIKPAIVPAEMGIDLQAPPFPRIIWQLISDLSGRETFFFEAEVGFPCSVAGPTSMHM